MPALAAPLRNAAGSCNYGRRWQIAAQPGGFLPYLWLYDGCPARGATPLTTSDETPAEAVRRSHFRWVAQSARAPSLFLD